MGCDYKNGFHWLTATILNDVEGEFRGMTTTVCVLALAFLIHQKFSL
jgi:hypothetical protein